MWETGKLGPSHLMTKVTCLVKSKIAFMRKFSAQTAKLGMRAMDWDAIYTDSDFCPYWKCTVFELSWGSSYALSDDREMNPAASHTHLFCCAGVSFVLLTYSRSPNLVHLSFPNPSHVLIVLEVPEVFRSTGRRLHLWNQRVYLL